MTGVVPPPREDLGLLAFAVACVSSAPPLIAATAAPALAIAFWRTGLGALALLPFVLGRRRAELRGASRGTIALAVFGGTMLAAHFSAFVPSLRLTSVASAAALVCSQAVWAGVFGRVLGERLPPRAWAGTTVALTGVVTITGVDVSLSARALGGDVLALLGGFFGGAYIVTGGLARRRLTTSAYI